MDFWIGLLCNDCNDFFFTSRWILSPSSFIFTIMNRSIRFFQRNVIIIIHRNHADTNQNIYIFLNFYIDNENTTSYFNIMQFLFFSILTTISEHFILFSPVPFSSLFSNIKIPDISARKIYQTASSSSTLNINNDWTAEVLFLQDRYIIIIICIFTQRSFRARTEIPDIYIGWPFPNILMSVEPSIIYLHPSFLHFLHFIFCRFFLFFSSLPPTGNSIIYQPDKPFDSCETFSDLFYNKL